MLSLIIYEFVIYLIIINEFIIYLIIIDEFDQPFFSFAAVTHYIISVLQCTICLCVEDSVLTLEC